MFSGSCSNVTRLCTGAHPDAPDKSERHKNKHRGINCHKKSLFKKGAFGCRYYYGGIQMSMKLVLFKTITLLALMAILLPACKQIPVIPESKSYYAAYTLTLPNTTEEYFPKSFSLQRLSDGLIVDSALNRKNRFYFRNLQAGKYVPAYASTEARGVSGNVRYVYIFSQMSAMQASVLIEDRNSYGGTIFVRASKYREDEADPFQRALMKRLSQISNAAYSEEDAGRIYYYSITESTVDISEKEKIDFRLFVKDDLSENIPF